MRQIAVSLDILILAACGSNDAVNRNGLIYLSLTSQLNLLTGFHCSPDPELCRTADYPASAFDRPASLDVTLR